MYGCCSHFTINFLLIDKFSDMFLFCCILIYMLLHCTKNVFVLVRQLCIVTQAVLGCVGAQRIMFLGRSLVQSTHLLPGGPRPVWIRLILELVRTRVPDSENQDTIDNNLSWRYVQFGNICQGRLELLISPHCAIVQSSFEPCSMLEFSYISSLPATTAS